MMKTILALLAIVAIASATSICDTYANPNTTDAQWNLVYSIIGDVFADATAPGALTARFFDGSIPGTRNFTGNPGNITEELAAHLTQFFGHALGCSDPHFPAYQGVSDMAAVHAALPINNVTFQYFNDAVIDVLDEDDVSESDQNAVYGVLESLRSAICNQPDCQPGGTTAAVATTASSTTTGGYNVIAPFVALIAISTTLFF